MNELYIEDFYRMLNDIYSRFVSCLWKMTPTTESGILQLAVLSVRYEETRIVKAALEITEDGHLKFLVFGNLADLSAKEPAEKTERTEYVVPLYSVEQALAEFSRIVNLSP